MAALPFPNLQYSGLVLGFQGLRLGVPLGLRAFCVENGPRYVLISEHLTQRTQKTIEDHRPWTSKNPIGKSFANFVSSRSNDTVNASSKMFANWSTKTAATITNVI